MNQLIQGKENLEKIKMLIGLTSIKSNAMHRALIEYYCSNKNRKKRATALMNDVKETNLNRDMKKINVVAGKLERLKELDWPDYQALRDNKKAA
jgi:hypothetical protein